MATVETSDDGGLHLPAELLGAVRPHAKFELQVLGGNLLLRPVERDALFRRGATPEERTVAFRHWAARPGPPAPDVPDESLRCEDLYD